MIRAGIAVLAGAVFAAGAAAQTQPSAQTPATSSSAAEAEAGRATLPSGTAVSAELNSSVDSKKAKVGDKVEAHTTEEIKNAGKTIVPIGAKVVGHVTEATARSKGDSGSTLAIQFDKAIPKKGEEISLNVAILAIAAPQGDFSGGFAAPSSDPMSGTTPAAAGGSPMGTSHTPMASPGRPSYPADGPPRLPSALKSLPTDSRGVYGLKDLKLMVTSSSAGQVTVITSSGKNVHLDGGTRLLLVVPEQVAAAPSK
ncbi:MAG: hypothetical protein WA765_15650 [Candidatus Acidiferrum sp.]